MSYVSTDYAVTLLAHVVGPCEWRNIGIYKEIWGDDMAALLHRALGMKKYNEIWGNDIVCSPKAF